MSPLIDTAIPNSSSRSATATAAPPLLPPHVFARSYGFSVSPNTSLKVCAPAPNSGVLVLPSVMAPAVLIFDTIVAEYRDFAKQIDLHDIVAIPVSGLKGDNITATSSHTVAEWMRAAVTRATGSRSAALPFLQPDGRNVVTSREALEFGAVPASLIVIGAGAIGGFIGGKLAAQHDVTLFDLLKAYGEHKQRKDAQVLHIAPTEYFSMDDALQRLGRLMGFETVREG